MNDDDDTDDSPIAAGLFGLGLLTAAWCAFVAVTTLVVVAVAQCVGG